MTICGAPSLFVHKAGWGTWLALALAAICLVSIALNYRGKGTHKAFLIALTGALLLVLALFVPDFLPGYYPGAGLLCLASFYNGRGYRWLSHILS